MTFLQHFISPLLRSLVLTFCIVCCVCIARRNKDDEPSAASPSYQIDSGFDYMPPPPTTNEFMSAREESNEMSPVLPGPPPPITSNASVGYSQASLARRDLEVEYIEEISDSSDSNDLVIGL